ncbi:uncharacterized protein LOC123541101 [Mercenaria mercenaria]|uniref:uncharacterized protein LOC123541101 n=1 Tax=Mercenaria mercenaria TaxID=6596 RepID=UPI00234FB59A|nr:uncharacterized protein LOC123541101 [Mercenaria mercenaria]
MVHAKLAKSLVMFLCVNLAINFDLARSEQSEDSWIPNWIPVKKLVCVSAVAGVIVTSPVLISALGITTTGITAGSLAAKLMSLGLFTKGGFLAWVQSMVMRGKITSDTAAYLIHIIKDACLD